MIISKFEFRNSKSILVLLIMAGFANPVRADDILIPSLTLDEYVDLAIKQGVQGRENEWNLEKAGYSRQIAFRQTDSPSMTFGHQHTRSDTYVNHFDSISESKQSTLSLTEPTPLGTVITANGIYGDAIGSNNGGKPGFTLSASQPLYLFVKNAVLRTRRQAELNFADAKDAYNSTLLSLRSQARGFYYDIMAAEESIKVEQRKVESTRKLLAVTQALVDAGKSAAVETMRAKINLQVDQRQFENSVVTRDKAMLNAKNFIYVPLDQPLEFPSTLQFVPFSTPVDHLIDFGLVHVPQLRTLRRDVELRRLDYETALEPTRPTFAVNGSYGYNESPNPFFITHNWTWTGTLNWLFFDSFVTRDRVRQARIAQQVAELNLAEAERTLRVNIQSAYWDIKNEEKQIKDFQNSREQAKRNVDILRLRFQNGLNQIIDVFDAENSMRNLDNEYLFILTQFNRSKDRLSELIGADVETLK